MVEQIVFTLRLFSPLLVAEDEVDPLVQVARDVVRLEGRPQLLDEVCRAVCPRGQGDVTHLGAAVADAEVDVVTVLEEVTLKQNDEQDFLCL